MPVKRIFLSTLLLSAGIIFTTTAVKAQAKSALGIGIGINGSTPGAGAGFRFEGEIKTTRAFSIVPAIGVELPYVVYAGLSGKYYFSQRFYGMLGPLAHLRSLEQGDSGIGGSAAAGYELISGRRSILDLNFHGDVIHIDDKAAPVIGLRLMYHFSFSRHNTQSSGASGYR